MATTSTTRQYRALARRIAALAVERAAQWVAALDRPACELRETTAPRHGAGVRAPHPRVSGSLGSMPTLDRGAMAPRNNNYAGPPHGRRVRADHLRAQHGVVERKMSSSDLRASIGVLGERFAGERRVSLVPADVRRLGKLAGIAVEAGAGAEAGYPDEAYVE